MIHRVEIKDKKNIFDAVGEGVKKDILDLGIKNIKDVKFVQVYHLQGELTKKDIRNICDKVFSDPITQEYTFDKKFYASKAANISTIEIAYNPGVTDPVEESAKKAINDIGITADIGLKTSKKYILYGRLTKKDVSFIAQKLLYNKAIQHIITQDNPFSVKTPTYRFKLKHANIIDADDHALIAMSKNGQLFLNLDEMKVIKKYFVKLKRNPTDCELETIAQTWSEHCKHKTFRGVIDYNGKKIKNLLKSTIMKATKELNKKWCVSVFEDNSGVIEFDKKNNICFKVETHNHPSALEPYGGAGTGIGGVIRDPLGTGKGGKPIANTDIFCFGPLDTNIKKMPKGMLHPKRIMKGVVSGVRDYGNRMGIPTVNGAVLFDKGYLGNPLVFCGNLGIMPKNRTEKKVSPGEMIVVVGGRTGRDGIHGATFSSGELTEESEHISGQAVQIGNPITEKKVVDALLKARDRNLYTSVTDCGAGGLSSAVGEMGSVTGAEVSLEKVKLKYNGLDYTEIWISEAQERMVLSVKRRNVKTLLSVFESENVEAVVIGKFTDTGMLKLYYEGNLVCNLGMDFLHDGLPDFTKKAVWKKTKHSGYAYKSKVDLAESLKKILSSPNVCSKEWVIRQYDHEVQGGSVLKPLQGVNCDGPGDAAVVRPLLDSKKGIAISNGINYRYGFIDPYWMAASCIDEAVRQIICVGGDLDKIAILDNFCWGNTNRPETLGALVRASMGCYNFSKAFGVPFISGKDSLNNEYNVKGKSISIPHTLLISAVGIIENVEKCITSDFKSPGNLIYIIGNTFNEMGGSHYLMLSNKIGNTVPVVNNRFAPIVMKKVQNAIKNGLIRSCHDCSEGGLGVTLSEMAFSGGIGADVSLKNVPKKTKISRNDVLLFSESNSRFIAEVPLKLRSEFEKFMKGTPCGLIGQCKDSNMLRVEGIDGNIVIEATLAELKKSWKATLSKL